MKLTVVALGHKMPPWVQAGFEEYRKRMPSEARIVLIELKPEDRASKVMEKVVKTSKKKPKDAEKNKF